jgi:hypothetical protein
MDLMIIECADSLSIILTWMQQYSERLDIDPHWLSHAEWEELSYGQLVTLFVAYVLHRR